MDDGPAPVFNVQTSSSSDFVVGRQTNFNAPVTIITNGSALTEESTDSEGDKLSNGVVLCGKLLAQDTAHAIRVAKGPTFIHITGPDKKLEDSSTQSLGRVGQLLLLRVWLGVPLFVWIIIALAVLCSFTVAIVQIFTGNEELVPPISTEEPEPPEDCRNFLGNSSHLFLTKKEWGGLNATSKIAINTPVPYVVISHTVSAFCYTIDSCSRQVQNIQKDAMSRTPPFADAPSNFFVGGDGSVYEARGWGIRSPHEGFVNNRNIDIAFIGDFSVQDVPTQTQVDAVIELLKHGTMHGHLDKDYILLPHNATSRTLSPGKNVYEIISQWDHFQADLPRPKKTS